MRLSFLAGASRWTVIATMSAMPPDSVSSPQAAPAIARGKLVRVLPDLPAAPRHVYAVYPTSRHLQPKVKAFVDFLAEHLPAAMRGVVEDTTSGGTRA